MEHALVLVAAVVCGISAWYLRRRFLAKAEGAALKSGFLVRIAEEICALGDRYGVRGLVPGSTTLVVVVDGQEVPVPLDRIHREFIVRPEEFSGQVRQLIGEIEEVALEEPQDHSFVDSALRLLPQVCSMDWLHVHAPAFGDAAIVHRELGPNLAVCYVIDEQLSLVYVCRAHLRLWHKTEEDIFHLATRNLGRMTGDLLGSSELEGPLRVSHGDGYDAARVLLLDPESARDLVVALPERNSLLLGRSGDEHKLVELMGEEDASTHPVSKAVYRVGDRRLLPISVPDPESE